MVVFDDLEQLMSFTSIGLDFQALVEAGHRQPIAFKDRDVLIRWAAELTDFELCPIGLRSLDNVMIVAGSTRFHARVYSQVWVRAGYKSYRRAMLQYYRESKGGSQIDRYDIDHAVSRKTLSRYWPEAWVNALYVESGINRSIGALMEQQTTKNLADTDTVQFNAECYLKLFYNRSGKLSRSRIAEYMQQVSRKFLTSAEQGANSKEIANVHRILNEVYSEAGCIYQSF